MDFDCTCNECSSCNECSQCNESVTINARVLRVCCCRTMLVRELCGCQVYLVRTCNACRFRPGQCVCITYSGASTMSIPPQINAESICFLNTGCGCRCGCGCNSNCNCN